MNSREAFEAWWGIAYDTAALRPIEDGCYTKRGAGMAWDAWQAATAHARDVAVQSCQSTKYAAPHYDREHEYNSGCDDCADAIKDALK